MLEFLIKGGAIIYPIMLCSVVAVAVFLERIWHLQKSHIIPDHFVRRIEELVIESRFDDALLLCQENYSPMANIMASALRNVKQDRARVKEAVEETGKLESAHLERYIEVIGTCSAISPLLGLLGTVLGMIEVFQGVENSGLGDPAFFASGIWKALITTAVGLSVAIPSFIFYKFLLARVDRLIIEMEARSLTLVDIVTHS
jgi:biopolymer transport protein ExbB